MAENFSTRALPDIHPRAVASIHNRSASASAAIMCHFFSPAPQPRNFNLWRAGKSVLCCGPADIPSRLVAGIASVALAMHCIYIN
jgi:hypothetical protein